MTEHLTDLGLHLNEKDLVIFYVDKNTVRITGEVVGFDDDGKYPKVLVKPINWMSMANPDYKMKDLYKPALSKVVKAKYKTSYLNNN